MPNDTYTYTQCCRRLLRFLLRVAPQEKHPLYELLLGPFAAFIRAFPIQFDTVITTAAVKLLPATMSTQSCQYYAACKVSALWHIYTSCKSVLTDTTDCYPYIIGIIIDQHMPLLLHPTFLTPHAMYCNKLAPEQVTPRTHHLARVQSHPNIEKILTDLWVPSYATIKPTYKQNKMQSTAAIDRSSEIKSVQSEFMSKKAQRHMYQSLLPPRATSHKSDASIQPSDMLLLTRAMPNALSLRTTLAQLREDIKAHPASIAVRILQNFLLGAYKHARHIAPPATRMRIYACFYQDSLSALCDIGLEKTNNWCIYTIISEYMIANIKELYTLHRVLQSYPRWAHYTATCGYVADKKMRGQLYPIKSPPRQKRTRQHSAEAAARSTITLEERFFKDHLVGELYPHPTVPTQTLFNCLQQRLCVKNTIPKKYIRALNISNQRLQEIYRLPLQLPNTYTLNLPVLAKMGMRYIDVQRIQYFLHSSLQYIKRTTTLLGHLCFRATAILYIYIHALTQRATFNITELPSSGITPSTAVEDVLVCQNCYTLRSKSRGLQKCDKLNGIIIDLEQDVPICTGCRSYDITSFNPYNAVITSKPLNGDKRHQVLNCSHCKTLTCMDTLTPYGGALICGTCHKTASDALQPTQCYFHNHPLFVTDKIPRLFCAYDAERNIVLYASCPLHQSYVPRGKTLFPVSHLIKQIEYDEEELKKQKK